MVLHCRMARRCWLACISLLAFLPGCSLVGCDDNAVAGIVAIVRDAQTGTGLARSASVVAQEAAFVDTFFNHFSDSLASGVFERPGTYRLDVTLAGYQTWTREGVRVRGGGCHVATRRVDADLVRLAP